MKVLTESEYEALVEEMAALVFDPDHDDPSVKMFSGRVIEMIADGREDDAREQLDEEVHETVMWSHSLPGVTGAAIDMDAVLAGCIIEHTDHAAFVNPSDITDEPNAHKHVRRLAATAMCEDVRSEVNNRVRQAVSDE